MRTGAPHSAASGSTGTSHAVFGDARLLVVDEDRTALQLLEEMLRRCGYEHVVSTSEASEAFALCAEVSPDLILLDLDMPAARGFEVLAQLASLTGGGANLPIVGLGADLGDDGRKRALSMGAKDFLAKPIQPVEASLRVRNLLETRRLYRDLTAHTRVLEDQIQLRTQELEVAQVELVQRLAMAAEHRDEDGPEHAQRVGRSAARLARELGVSDEDVRIIRLVAPLHDIGNIGIPDAVLMRPAKLTHAQFELMKSHSTIGNQLLSGGRSRHLRMAAQIARSHHERWDGAGYPDGLAGEEIPLAARLTAIADVFDALAHRRPHKEAWSLDDVLAEIEREAGGQFDPGAVRAFRSLDHEALLARVKPLRPGNGA